jgi:UDP-GlcNAc:undecaprenyl-phosphate/decaprenyl-phosphate GlcNAc-1-phosphate transferase
MYSVILLAVVSLYLTLLLTPAIRAAFLRLGIVDRPDHLRKFHTHAIPRAGGVAIGLSYLAAFGILILSPLHAGDLVLQHLPLVWRIMPALGIVLAIGLIDDLVGLKPSQKLLGQLVAAGLAYWAGVRIVTLAGIPIGWWSLPLTILWLMACTNAFNLIDGLDGLATGIGLLASITILSSALLSRNLSLALTIAPLIGCLLGFLRYNFSPASIFLGDSGSLLIGLILGCSSVIWSQKTTTLLGMAAPLMALAIPLFDTGLSIIRRFLRLRPIFGADRGHIHHRMLELGFSPRHVALVLYGFGSLAAIFSLLQSVIHAKFAVIMIVVFCLAALLSIKRLHYPEFYFARRLVREGAFQRMLDAEILIREFERSLSRAITTSECWEAVRDGCREFGFTHVRMCLDGDTFEEQIRDVDPGRCWSLRVPLSDSDYLTFAKEFDWSGPVPLVESFIRVVRRTLEAKRLESRYKKDYVAAGSVS